VGRQAHPLSNRDRLKPKNDASTELVHLSAVDPRRPSRPAAVAPRSEAGYTTASAGQQTREPLATEGGPYTWFYSKRTAPTRRVIAASLGKMPDHLGEGHVGEDILLGLVEGAASLDSLGRTWFGLGGAGVVLGEAGGDEGGDDATRRGSRKWQADDDGVYGHRS
jgi:hypothetical protein